jgi:microcystin-dependent protein
MSSPFVAEIRIWACNFPPSGWAFCNGQLMPISQNTALFSLIGTFYGGDGKSNFALPNLQASAPMFWGQGPGLSERFLGETAGAPYVTLLDTEMPVHAHSLMASPDPGDLPAPAPDRSLARSQPYLYKQPAGAAPAQPLSLNAVAPSGGSQPHNNLMPYLTLNVCIALQGIFPSRP